LTFDPGHVLCGSVAQGFAPLAIHGAGGSKRNKKPKEASLGIRRFFRFLNRYRQNPGDYFVTRGNKIHRWCAFQGIEEFISIDELHQKIRGIFCYQKKAL
jgi:hypothetical protein